MFKRAKWNLFHDDLQDEDGPVRRMGDSDSSDSDSDGDTNQKMARASERFAKRTQRGFDIQDDSEESEDESGNHLLSEVKSCSLCRNSKFFTVEEVERHLESAWHKKNEEQYFAANPGARERMEQEALQPEVVAEEQADSESEQSGDDEDEDAEVCQKRKHADPDAPAVEKKKKKTRRHVKKHRPELAAVPIAVVVPQGTRISELDVEQKRALRRQQKAIARAQRAAAQTQSGETKPESKPVTEVVAAAQQALAEGKQLNRQQRRALEQAEAAKKESQFKDSKDSKSSKSAEASAVKSKKSKSDSTAATPKAEKSKSAESVADVAAPSAKKSKKEKA